MGEPDNSELILPVRPGADQQQDDNEGGAQLPRCCPGHVRRGGAQPWLNERAAPASSSA